ncbi:MAG: flippase-like domain-containing protein [Candidatus Cloacimonetes bacterium]|nr:flippase-like domain-containing protein [Candidatus Cloacimonadota bacterium]
MDNKNRLNSFIGILLGIVFLILWLRIINWQEFIHYFKNFELKSVLFFSLFYVFAYFIRSFRWKIILNPIYKMKISESFAIFMSGLLINYLVPVRAGEVAKSVILKNKREVRISKSLPTVFIDKLCDLFPIVLILILIPLLSVKMNPALYIIIILLFFIFLAFLGFLIFSINHKSKAAKILHSLLKLLPKKLRLRFEDFFTNFVDGMTIMQNRYSAIFLVCLLTLCAVLSEALYIFAVFRAFGSDICYWKILFGYTLMNLTYILPTPPAQIGSNQFMWVLIFSFAVGINENLTSAAVTFSHLLTSIWIFLIGEFSLLALKIKFHDLVSKKVLAQKSC